MRKFKGHYQRAIETVCVVQTKSEVPSTFLWVLNKKIKEIQETKARPLKLKKAMQAKGFTPQIVVSKKVRQPKS